MTPSGATYLGGFAADIPDTANGKMLTFTFTARATITSSSALIQWSYLVDGKLMVTPSPSMITLTAVPEPSSSVMAAIATGVGLVIGWNRFNRTHGCPRQGRW